MPEIDLGSVIGPQGGVGPIGPQGPGPTEAQLVSAINTQKDKAGGIAGHDATLAGLADRYTKVESDAALANKVSIYGINAKGLDLNNHLTDGRYQCIGEVLNSPPWHGGLYGHFFVDVFCHNNSWVTQMAYATNAPGIYTRQLLDGVWIDWERLATATKPQEFDLPLEAGLRSVMLTRYHKTQEQKVCINIAICPTEGGVMANNQVVATLPVGYRASGDVAFPHSVDGFFMANALGQIAWIGAAIQSPGYRSSYLEFVAAPTDTISSQVRMASSRAARSAIPQEPVSKCMCVVDEAGNYVEFVLVTISHDEQGELRTVHYYTMQDGEKLIDVEHPNMRPYTGEAGFVKPRWDNDAWTEAATPEEITAWEAEHPNPITLDSAKASRQSENKAALAAYLAAHPLTWTDGKQYGVTEQDQSEIALNLTQYQLSVQAGQSSTLQWHSIKSECTDWTFEALTALTLAIAAFVYPYLRYQESVKAAIYRAETVEVVQAVTVDYAGVT